MPECTIFAPADLLPDSWRHFETLGPVRLFNPGLLKDGSGWIFAYRVVGPDLNRRIAICRLDEQFRAVPRSQSPLSDQIVFPSEHQYSERATKWFADPRLYRLAGRIFVYWNSGWHDPHNHQFLQELDRLTLRSVGFPRELRLRGERRPIEKNWMLFGDGPFYAVYSTAPHRILQFRVDGEGDIDCMETASVEWKHGDYACENGGLRGGAPPQLVDGRYESLCHFIANAPEGFRYIPTAYRFSSVYPFRPTDGPVRPLPLANPFGARNVHEKLNPVVGEVIYPSGAAWDDGRWVISYGINDELCAITTLSEAAVQDSFRTLGTASGERALQPPKNPFGPKVLPMS